METKTIVKGLVPEQEESQRTGRKCFYFLNGDIEIDGEGNEVYIETRRKSDSNEMEDTSVKVSEMPIVCQRYIETHKETVTIPEDGAKP